MDVELLKKLTSIPGTSGDESGISDFVKQWFEDRMEDFVVKPKIYSGDHFQDCLVVVFGEPRTAVYAHIDTIGFTVGYEKDLIKIGSPVSEDGIELVGLDSSGDVEAITLLMDDDDGHQHLQYVFERQIDRGTRLNFKAKFIEDEEAVQCCYMDNRLGVYNALKLAETLENGALVFSTWEEQGGGSVGYLARFLYDNYGIRQALISDITWVTEGVKAGGGVAISMRDAGLPRQSFVDRIIELANQTDIPFQLEVEGAGGSDGLYLQRAPYPIDWIFIGAPEENVHSPKERVHKSDIEAMLLMYRHLIEAL